MIKVGLLSDTHAYWDDKYAEYFKDCDEIWHAGEHRSMYSYVTSEHRSMYTTYV